MLKVLELYSGIGGMHYALLESGIQGKIVESIDINTNANAVYKHNFSHVKNLNQNIQNLNISDIRKLDINAIFMSPPCQPFTRVGLKKDLEDYRTSSLFHVLNLISQINSLKYILVENVRGFETSDTRNKLVSCLQDSDFKYKEFLLSPCQFGIPNSRQRYYLLAKKKDLSFAFKDQSLMESIPESLRNLLPKSKHEILADTDNKINVRNGRKCYTLKHILEDSVDDSYLISPDILKKRWSVLDIRNSNSNGSCCFTKAYSHYSEGTGSVYCPYSEQTLLNTFHKLTNSELSDQDILNLLKNLHLRYFTPKEISRLMCFPENFLFPNDITNKQKYKLLGNSINVFVVSRLIYILYTDFENYL